MDDCDHDLRSLLKADLEARREALDWHPALEQLEAFQKGDLPTTETSRIRHHLPLCPDCADFVLSLGDLRGLPAGASEEIQPEEVEAAWSDFQAKIRREGNGSQRWQRRLPLGLAAVLALAVTGLSLWCWQLYGENRRREGNLSDLTAALKTERERSADLSVHSREQGRRLADLDRELAAVLRPRINTPVIDLAPRSFRGAGAARSPVEIPAGSDLFTLVLEPEDLRSYSTYEVEIVTPSGRVLWKLERLEKTDFGSFTLTLFRSDLPPGPLTIVVFGRRNGKREEIGKYDLYIPPS